MTECAAAAHLVSVLGTHRLDALGNQLDLLVLDVCHCIVDLHTGCGAIHCDSDRAGSIRYLLSTARAHGELRSVLQAVRDAAAHLRSQGTDGKRGGCGWYVPL